MLGLAEVAGARGDYDRAYQLAAEALEIVQMTGDVPLQAELMHTLALLTLYRGEWETADAWGRAGLELLAEIGNQPRVVECLATLARIAAGHGEMERAATLFGAVEVLGRAGRYTSGLASWEATERDREAVRERLDAAAFQSAWSAGGVMRLDQAVAFALTIPDAAGGDQPATARSDVRRPAPVTVLRGSNPRR
jgi:ATP/maltotriose-dependent transcriptional regulator MalT